MYFVVLNNLAFLIIYPWFCLAVMMSSLARFSVEFLFFLLMKIKQMYKQNSLYMKKIKTHQKHICRYKADMTIRYIININN